MKRTGLIIAAVLLGVALLFGLELLGLEWTKFFAPKRANIERQVFEQTQSHVHGMVQQLAKYKLEYDTGDASTKAILKQTIVAQFATFDADAITNEGLKQFLIDTRGF